MHPKTFACWTVALILGLAFLVGCGESPPQSDAGVSQPHVAAAAAQNGADRKRRDEKATETIPVDTLSPASSKSESTRTNDKNVRRIFDAGGYDARFGSDRASPGARRGAGGNTMRTIITRGTAVPRPATFPQNTFRRSSGNGSPR
jgi:hypothetical protein